MNTYLYQEFFEHVAFPIFATDPSGKVLYKNQACRKHQPMVRKGAQIIKRLSSQTLPEAGELVYLREETPYAAMLTFADKEGLLFLAPPRLQMADAQDIAHTVFEHCGRTPTSLLTTHKKAENYVEKGIPSRIYTDILDIFRSKTTVRESQAYQLDQITKDVFPKLTRSFAALGYRIQTQTDDSFTAKNTVRLYLFDFYFWIGRLFYLAMKLSQTKNISASLSSDPISEEHILSIQAQNACVSQETNLSALFAKVAPECALELSILSAATEMFERTSVRQDPRGTLTLEYRMAYSRASTLAVHADLSHPKYALFMTPTLIYIRKMLKEHVCPPELL